jgi:hypothetical protein
LLELASLQPWCYGNKQSVRLLCCCRPLSAPAIHLALPLANMKATAP